MGSALDHVSSAAVWIGLGAWLLLGAFMAVQAAVAGERRRQYAVFAFVALARAALDLGHLGLEKSTYELLRLVWVGAYVGACLALLGRPPRRALSVAAALAVAGCLLWKFGGAASATTIAFPAAFAAIALAFAGRTRQARGYASSFLCASFTAMAVGCATYYPTIQSTDPRVLILGYSNMALLNSMAVLLGWVHLPRELAGRAPVLVEPNHVNALVAAFAICETLLVSGLFLWFNWPPVLYLAGTTVLLLSGLALFFHHRHRLIIYADDVTGLLEERTASLRAAKEELARQNERQALRLEEQARDLEAKAEVIERQRRLELAGQTAGQAAHDIQNLIVPILAEADRLEKATEQLPTVRQAVERVRRRLEHILQVSAQVLALARRGRLEVHPISLLELAHGTADQIGDARLEIRCDDEAWTQGSWSQVSRALANLIQNALEALPRRRDSVLVRIRTARVESTQRCHLGFLPPGRYAALEVEDTGPGIPAGVRERIFEPFFSSKSGKPRSGSGLGLAIVHAVTQDHRGVIDLKTGPEGTCFTLYFPAIDPPADLHDGEAPRGQGVVLIADDDVAVRDRYEMILRKAGYSVLAARDGREALDVLRTLPVDVVLLDLKMPILTGNEVYQGVLDQCPRTRVIVHSSYVLGEEAGDLRAAGVSAILAKPAGREELLRTIREVLTEGPASPINGRAASD